jgi:hypothetical protein
LMQDIANEEKFTGDTIGLWISNALADYPLDALQNVIGNATDLLPQNGLLADSVKLGIKRMWVPLELIKAITEGEGDKTWALAGGLRDCCNPAKWGDKKPGEAQANAMMTHMLERALGTLSDEQLYALSLKMPTAEQVTKHPAVLILGDLLATTYRDRIVLYADATDQ